MKKLIYDPSKRGSRMTIVCFISGSGTNYREIAARNPDHKYLIFTNRPGCKGTSIARENRHEVIELSHVPYLKEARKRYGAGHVPRNCPERLAYEQEAVKLIEKKLDGEPDLICLAGYDQWNTDWMIERYYPRILNIHPGDTTRGYAGLHWVPAAKAIISGDNELRSTLFFVDQSFDEGPVLAQSLPLDILQTLTLLEARGEDGLLEGLRKLKAFISSKDIKTYEEFTPQAGGEIMKMMERICCKLQDALKVAGDWKIYPFIVHDLISKGRVEMEDRTVYVDGQAMPLHGYRPDEHLC
jgi:folate-dependent phosphoribosylglycinamide formyltransferase PurN